LERVIRVVLNAPCILRARIFIFCFVRPSWIICIFSCVSDPNSIGFCADFKDSASQNIWRCIPNGVYNWFWIFRVTVEGCSDVARETNKGQTEICLAQVASPHRSTRRVLSFNTWMVFGKQSYYMLNFI
jgi:hypothetical protein